MVLKIQTLGPNRCGTCVVLKGRGTLRVSCLSLIFWPQIYSVETDWVLALKGNISKYTGNSLRPKLLWFKDWKIIFLLKRIWCQIGPTNSLIKKIKIIIILCGRACSTRKKNVKNKRTHSVHQRYIIENFKETNQC